jgi:hypothetical protein
MGKPPRTPIKKPPSPQASGRQAAAPPPRAPAKRPLARSVRQRRPAAVGPNIKALIADELYIQLERLGADEELLSIVSSWYDIFDDAEVLALLQEYRQGRRVIRQRH